MPSGIFIFTNHLCYVIIYLIKVLIKNAFIQEANTMAKEKRFIKIYSQEMGSTMILVDKETGVNYLFISSGYAGGLTVLLDKDGKPVITSVEEK